MTAARAPVRAVLLDVEGTTTPIAFVYGTLFPYARTHLRAFLEAHHSDATTAPLIARLREEQMRDADAPHDASPAEYVEWLMDRDRKSTALKDLQGRIWEQGFRRGELRGDVFADVAPALDAWHQRGIDVGIFSSGSVLAQRLLFEHSSAGNLEPLLRWHFDTTTGAKGAPESYQRIAKEIGAAPGAILFVSDVVSELDAARTSGMRTALSIRPGNAPIADGHGHPVVHGFDELQSM